MTNRSLPYHANHKATDANQHFFMDNAYLIGVLGKV